MDNSTAALSSILTCIDEPSFLYAGVKRTFDIVMCVVLAPVMIVTSLVLLVLNPSRNRGPLFYVQTRMGKDCQPFRAIKFRSMTCADVIERGANDPLETDRITRLGNFLRRSRLDEVPQIINVLKGEMSLVGPRPDYIVHAQEYVETIEGYEERHSVRPGISGYAQTEVGYAESVDATREKVVADLHYIKNRSLGLEAWIVWRTIQTVICRGGA
jgi:lipopolysaccharide/colanic/teichoic acid biosynthesis glycosyltransferase